VTLSVVLFGAGSPIVVDVEESCARRGWRIVAVVKNVDGPDYASDPKLLVSAGAARLGDHPVVLPLFGPANRNSAREHAISLGARDFATLIDPTSVVPKRLEVGEGSYINAGCTLGGATRIGRFAFINRGCSLGHHLTLGDFVSIGPGVVIAGQVEVGEGAMIGAGAVILPKVRIGAGAVVGAGAIVVDDVAASATLIPAGARQNLQRPK